MKTVFMILVLISQTSLAALAEKQNLSSSSVIKTWTFSYKPLKSQQFQIKKNALTFEEAFKSAAKECYQQMTQGKYPGEDKGLEIIDICANPKS